MEMKLASNSRAQLERNTKELIGKLASVLSARATRFNGMCYTVAHNIFQQHLVAIKIAFKQANFQGK